MKKIIIIILLVACASFLAAFHNPKIIGVYISTPEGATPSEQATTFNVYVSGRPSDILTESSPGCDYVPKTGYGICYINMASFSNVWAAEDRLLWSIYQDGTIYGMANMQVQDETGASQYLYSSSDPYDLSSIPLPITLSSFMAIYCDGLPVLNWVTQSEISNSGWNIYRSENEQVEESVQINPELIPGGGTSSVEISYSFTDNYEVNSGVTYWYYLESVDFGGNSETYGPISLEIPEGGENPEPDIPPVYGVHCNYPNPFNPDTAIEFVPEKAGYIEINILNIKGQLVKTIYSDNIEEKEVGSIRTAVWDGTNQRGKKAGSGIYFCSYKSTARNQITKMVLIK